MTSDNKTSHGFTLSVKDYPKLHGQSDYQDWAKAWEIAFKVTGLWSLVNGTKTKPASTTTTQAVGEASSSKAPEESEEVIEWERLNNEAQFFLIQAVDNTFLQDVTSDTAATAWQALKDRFDKETATTSMMLLEAVIKTKLTPGKNISEHVSNFENAWNRLAKRCASSKGKSDDDFLAAFKSVTHSEAAKGTFFMCSVKDIYPDLCDMLAARKEDRYADIRSFFLDRAAEKSEKNGDDKALFVPKSSNKECSWCKKRKRKFDNHSLNDCREMKREKDKTNNNRSNHTATSANTDATVTVLMTQVVDNTKEGSTEWLCDSG